MTHEKLLLICPLCQQPLTQIESEKTYKCLSNHCFDVAKQGYVNLLPVNEKKSKSPGDSKEMVLARRDFLSKGFYAPVSDALNQQLVAFLRSLKGEGVNKESHALLDLGCGEGYYTGRLKKVLEDQSLLSQIYGLDISKEAVKYAASADKGVVWMVGNNFHVPLASNSLDCLFSVFSPIQSEECARLLKPKGLFARVLPGIHHLIEMRELIYDKVIFNEDGDYTVTGGGLTFLNTVDVTYKIHLNNEELLSLVKMTPHYWHTSKADKASLNTVTALDVTIDMKILLYEKQD